MDSLVARMRASGIGYNDAVRAFKRHFLLGVLADHRGNQCKAAKELGVHRNTLSRMLAELEIDAAVVRNGARRPPSSERGGFELKQVVR